MTRTNQALIEASLQEGIELRQRCRAISDTIERAGDRLVETFRAGGRVFLIGNGGSAADAQHIAAELVGRFEKENCLPALALTTDTSILTSVGNDFGFDQIYVRQVRALARRGDLLIALSTSGSSPNILRAVEAARDMGMTVLGMAGESGGQLASLCDVCVNVPTRRTCRVQEMHIAIGHIWCEMIEAADRQAPEPGRVSS